MDGTYWAVLPFFITLEEIGYAFLDDWADERVRELFLRLDLREEPSHESSCLRSEKTSNTLSGRPVELTA